ncbi:MAG TPA: von Willebrand factor type A domain-containing protein, partial [Opitutaceae bacterium]|nr:von Willebrand factor type A domain-containing protein [Opitutaceae bacterium]
VAGGVDPGQTAAQPKSAAPTKPSAVRLPRPPERPWWRNEWFYSAAACVVISIGGFWMLGTVPKSYEATAKAAVHEVSIPFEISEEDAPGALPEPMNTVGFVDVTTVLKSAAPTQNWALPSKQTRSLSVTAPALRPRLAKVEVASAYGYTGTTDDGTTGVLDKFEVSEDDVVGYMAQSTVAGTRLTTNLNLPGIRVRTELKDVASSISAGAKEREGPRDAFLSKRKTERPATALGGKGRAASPATPEIGGDAEEEQVVLSPFVVSAPNDSGYLRSNRAPKLPKRPDPSATTAGMGPGALNTDQVLLPESSTQSTTSTPSTESAPPAAAADNPLPRPAQKPAAPPPTADETSAAQEPVSTFSLHVSDASFKLALTALAAGRLPDAASIRPEEFYNAFDYGDPAPGAGEKVSCRIEQAAHPFAQQRNLVRIAVRVPATGRGSGTPLNLTVLLDTSGSMERPDRRAAVRAALSTLVGLLGPADRVTLIGFARQPRLLADAFDGAHAGQLLDLLDRTPAEGGTNLEEALKLGGELARRHFSATAQNRLVLLTDGAANLGNADPERLAASIESLRSQRIAFDACGVGLEGVDDDMLEALTRKGDGRYYVLDSPEAADAGFARQLAGAFRPAAENVKLQVRFNPARVGRYRLVGFEKHRLREEDFRNDAVDAAELAAEEAAVALYEVEVLPQGEGEVAEVLVRFRDAASKEMVERGWTVPYEPRAAAFDRTSSSLQLAGTAAALAEKLRGGPAGDRVDLDALAPFVAAQRARRPDDKRLQDLATMFEQLRRMKR